MSLRVCEICGKHPQYGNIINRRGIRKKSGGIGLHITGVTRRMFLPNLQTVKAITNGSVRRVCVCTSCIRAGKITKAPVRKIPAAVKK